MKTTKYCLFILNVFLKSKFKEACTVCPGSSDPFYIVTYYIKWVTTSWTMDIRIVIFSSTFYKVYDLILSPFSFSPDASTSVFSVRSLRTPPPLPSPNTIIIEFCIIIGFIWILTVWQCFSYAMLQAIKDTRINVIKYK